MPVYCMSGSFFILVIPKKFSCVSCASQRMILCTQCASQKPVVPATVQCPKSWGCRNFSHPKIPPSPGKVCGRLDSVWLGSFTTPALWCTRRVHPMLLCSPSSFASLLIFMLLLMLPPVVALRRGRTGNTAPTKAWVQRVSMSLCSVHPGALCPEDHGRTASVQTSDCRCGSDENSYGGVNVQRLGALSQPGG